jgi:DNA replication licensing factor MCM6
VESSEIDLSEFQEAYGDGGDGGNDGPSQGDAQPSNADANPVSENTGRLLYPKLFFFFYSNFSLNYRDCTENGAASASRQGKKLVISEEYFQRVTQALVMRLRQHEEAVMRDGKLQDPFHSCFMIFMFLC